MNRSVLAMTLFLSVAMTRADELPKMVFFVADDHCLVALNKYTRSN